MWDVHVPNNGAWDVLEIIWNGATVKPRGHEGQHVKWNVSNFIATYDEADATEFVLARSVNFPLRSPYIYGESVFRTTSEPAL